MFPKNIKIHNNIIISINFDFTNDTISDYDESRKLAIPDL